MVYGSPCGHGVAWVGGGLRRLKPRRKGTGRRSVFPRETKNRLGKEHFLFFVFARDLPRGGCGGFLGPECAVLY